MKTKIVITILGFLAVNAMQAQEKNYAYYTNQLDNLEQKYAVEDIFYPNTLAAADNDSNAFRKLFKDNYLSATEKQLLVNKVSGFYEQDSYIGLYYIAQELLEAMYDVFKDENLRQQIINIRVNKVRYTDRDCQCWLGFLPEYNTEKTKERLKELMKGELNEEETKIYNRREEVIYNYPVFINAHEAEAKKIMKKTKRRGKNNYRILLDSLKTDYLNARAEETFSPTYYKPVDWDCLYLIGSMQDSTFIPYLEEYARQYPQQKRACTYALAKLGVQKYIDDILENNNNIPYKYLGTKEAYLRWLEINFDWKKRYQFSIPGAYYPKAFVVMFTESNYHLQNIPLDLKLNLIEMDKYRDSFEQLNSEQQKNYDPLKDEENKELIQKVNQLYQWIKDNPDKWELSPAEDTL
jgi:hypothetical protein